jgi:hypothetical protein
MKILITGGGIYGAEGELPVGTQLTLDDEPTAWAGRYQILDPDAKAEKVDGEGDKDDPDYVPVGPFLASGSGAWWDVLDANGKKVKRLRKADAEAFNGLSEEDRAEFLKGEA